MSKVVFVFLTTGFEEIEALATIDTLRRAELEVQSVSLTGEKWVTGAHLIKVEADQLFDEVDFTQGLALIIPGGTIKYAEHDGLNQQLLAFAKKGQKIAAICAAPAVLAKLGLLKGRNATCYPGFEDYLEGANLQSDKSVVVDDNITTGRGPGLALEFALSLVRQLVSQEKAQEVAQGLLIKY